MAAPVGFYFDFSSPYGYLATATRIAPLAALVRAVRGVAAIPARRYSR